MKIYTSYYGQLRNLDKVGILPISISRITPKYFKGMWYEGLAPTYNMRNLAVSTFHPAFKKYILSPKSQEKVIQRLRVMSEGYEEIALICYEAPDKFCHRQLVKDWLNGWIVPNFGEEHAVTEFIPPAKEEKPKARKLVQQLTFMF